MKTMKRTMAAVITGLSLGVVGVLAQGAGGQGGGENGNGPDAKPEIANEVKGGGQSEANAERIRAYIEGLKKGWIDRKERPLPTIQDAELKALVEEARAKLTEFATAQKELAAKLKDASKEEREAIREQMRGAVEKFRNEQRERVQEIKERLQELRAEFKNNRDRQIEEAQEQARKGRGE